MNHRPFCFVRRRGLISAWVIGLFLAGALLSAFPAHSRYCAGDREIILVRIEQGMWWLQTTLRELAGAIRPRGLFVLERAARRVELWEAYLSLRGEMEKSLAEKDATLDPARMARWLEPAARARQAFLNVDFIPDVRRLALVPAVASATCRVIAEKTAEPCHAILAWDSELADFCRSPVIDLAGYARLCDPSARGVFLHSTRWLESFCRLGLAEAALGCGLEPVLPIRRFISNCEAFTADNESLCPEPPDGDRKASDECRAPIWSRRLVDGRLSIDEYAARVRLEPIYLRALEAFFRDPRRDCARAALSAFDDEAREFFETWP
jgi:hypothetical protein